MKSKKQATKNPRVGSLDAKAGLVSMSSFTSLDGRPAWSAPSAAAHGFPQPQVTGLAEGELNHGSLRKCLSVGQSGLARGYRLDLPMVLLETAEMAGPVYGASNGDLLVAGC